jgi:O-antigen/teichoic acid export membrane protein
LKKIIATSLIFTFINICINLTFKIISSRIITKEDLGLFFSVIDIFSLTLLLLVGFRSSMIVSFIKTQDESNIINIFRYFFIATILITWTFVLPYVKHKIGIDIHYWYLVFMIISMGLVTYFNNLISMHREYDTLNTTTILEPILSLGWFLTAYYIAGVSGYQTLFISTIMSSLGVAFYMWRQHYKQNNKISFKLAHISPQMKDFLKNSMISTLEFGSGVVMVYLSVMLIMHYFSPDELGDFQVVVKSIFVYMIMLFVFPIFRFIMPELSKLLKNKEYTKIAKLKKEIYIFAFIVSSIFLAIMWFFGQNIIIYLFTKKYISAYIMLIHLSFFYIFVILNAYNISYIKASGKFWWALWIRLSGSISMLCIFFILHYFSHSVITVILSLIWGYVIMFAISFLLETKLRKSILNTI